MQLHLSRCLPGGGMPVHSCQRGVRVPSRGVRAVGRHSRSGWETIHAHRHVLPICGVSTADDLDREQHSHAERPMPRLASAELRERLRRNRERASRAGTADAATQQLPPPPSGESPVTSTGLQRASAPGPANGAYHSATAAAGPSVSSSAPLPPPSWRRPTPQDQQRLPQIAGPRSALSISNGSSEPSARSSGPAQSPAADQAPSEPEPQPVNGAQRRYGSYSSPAAQRALTELSGTTGVLRRGVPTSHVTFRLQYHVSYGQVLRVTGSHANIGGWSLANAPLLSWSEGDNWHVTVDLPTGSVAEYKYVVTDASSGAAVAWQAGNNSVLAVQHGEAEVEVFDNWFGQPGAAVVADGLSGTRENRLLSWADEIAALVAVQRDDLRRSRMELVAAQQDAREAREESRRVAAELVASEAMRQELALRSRSLETTNRLLRLQLAATTSSFRAAMATAQAFLDQAVVPEITANDRQVAEDAVELVLPKCRPPPKVPEETGGGSGGSATSSSRSRSRLRVVECAPEVELAGSARNGAAKKRQGNRAESRDARQRAGVAAEARGNGLESGSELDEMALTPSAPMGSPSSQSPPRVRIGKTGNAGKAGSAAATRDVTASTGRQ